MSRRGILVALIVLVGALACEAEEGGGTTATFGTYNAGLAYAYVPHAELRQPLIGPALGALEADVLCLQEIWEPAHVAALLAATADEFPHHYWVDTTDAEGSSEPSCGAEEAAALQSCALENCGSSAAGLADCVPTACPAEFGALSSGCLQCLVANLGVDLDEMVAACAEAGGPTYTYNGVNGLVLLSRWPFAETEARELAATFLRRVVLYARVEVGEAGEYEVLCTHLTPDFDDVPYPGDFESWVDEQAHQLQALLDWAEQKQGNEPGPLVFMGDTNCGPAAGGAGAEFPENYALLTAAALSEPFATGEAAQCTYCAENPLNVSGARDVLIDHVMFRNVGGTFTARRVLDEPVTLETDEGPVEARLSDHYGVVVTVHE